MRVSKSAGDVTTFHPVVPPVRSKAPAAISRVSLPTPPGEDRLKYDGCVCSEATYVLKCTDETYDALRRSARQRASTKGANDICLDGVTFLDETRTVEIHLDPIHAGRLLGKIDVYGEARTSGLQQPVHAKYDEVIQSMAAAWIQATSHLVSREFDFAGDTGVGDPRMFPALIDDVLSKHKGFCAGEASHLDNQGLLAFLTNNMEKLSGPGRGVTTIYTEYLTAEICAKFPNPDGSLDFASARTSDMFLKEVHGWPYGEAAMKVFEEAHRCGVRMVGINSFKCYPLAMDEDRDDESESDMQRGASMNLVAARVIENDACPGNFIVWGGAGHFDCCRSGNDPWDVRGINVPFDIPCIIFSESKSGEWGVFHQSDAPQAVPSCASSYDDSLQATQWTSRKWDAWVSSPLDSDMRL